MDYLILGFLTGLSLILAIGAQNIFVIEQGLKKQYIFIVCLICSISDFLLIFLGIFLFQYLNHFFTPTIELVFNILLLIFLLHFIWGKIKNKVSETSFDVDSKTNNLSNIVVKTLGFTFLNPHVYSDTVFFLGNFSKSLSQVDKYYFGAGAAISSFLFFFIIGYLSKYFSKYLKSATVWKRINYLIILFMSILALTVLMEII
ncbi:LysE family transporter [Candidatus Pelagibacter ubique]|jgi:L-lysine exporter family protein LysE/ArgO|nr:LysE family transporter [Candidatus Pelagibacter bacterium]MDA7452173.1 LysE family transporter [Candidatus Pelagibacter ubique]MDA7477644.1 LysE family transporter [Candidatus Pelagibacter ubique]MDA8835967.1 LysE family transporter [Candidatus Pelagibacter bacterium]MDC1044208.1 LysE family transporter [Candidatus Pelagibacter ubique]